MDEKVRIAFRFSSVFFTRLVLYEAHRQFFETVKTANQHAPGA